MKTNRIVKGKESLQIKITLCIIRDLLIFKSNKTFESPYKKAGDPNFLYYIFVLLCVLHVTLENKNKIISIIYIIVVFSGQTSKNTCLRRWKKRQYTSKVFRFAKIPHFLTYNNKIRICIKVLVKKVY